jgi:DNA-binding CsgD family transcriptional regulator
MKVPGPCKRCGGPVIRQPVGRPRLYCHACANRAPERSRKRSKRGPKRRVEPVIRHGGVLTPAERKVAELAVAGASNLEIAAQLGISTSLVAWRMGQVYVKLGTDSREDLVLPPASTALEIARCPWHGPAEMRPKPWSTQRGRGWYCLVCERIRNRRRLGLEGSGRPAMSLLCPSGHPLEGDNVYRDPNGARRCRICRAERHRRVGPWRRRLTQKIGDRDGWRCGLCGRKIRRALRWPNLRSASVDHIIPVSEGGTNEAANLQIAHLGCNVAKRERARGEQLRLLG